MASFDWPNILAVNTLNGLSGAVTLVAGSNITITPSGQNLTIAAAGGGSGFSTIGTIDTGIASADGLNASGTTLYAQSADATHPGMMNTGAQTIAGDKTFSDHLLLSALTANRAVITFTGGLLTTSATTSTQIGYLASATAALANTSNTGLLSSTDWNTFNGKQAALTIGNLTDAGTDGIVVTGGTGAVIGSGTSLAQHVADSTHNGYLSSTDWSTFNGKQASGNYITALTGDATATGPGSVALTLATVNSNVGTFASVTVNGKGLVTAAANLSGDATTSSSALTLATVNSNVGSFGSSTAIPAFTVNGKGLVTAASTNVVIAPAGTLTGTTLASNVVTSSLTSVGTITSGTWNGTTIAIANGGTGQTSKQPAFDALSPLTTKGDINTFSTVGARLGVGADTTVLAADSTQTTGLNWFIHTSSTYTPTVGTTTNVAASGSFSAMYIRIGSMVMVAGEFAVTATAGSIATPTDTRLQITLPVASNIGASSDVSGFFSTSVNAAGQVGGVRGNAANDRAEIYFLATLTSSQTCRFGFMYTII